MPLITNISYRMDAATAANSGRIAPKSKIVLNKVSKVPSGSASTARSTRLAAADKEVEALLTP